VEEREVFRALARRYSMTFDESDALLPRVDPELALGIPQRFREFNRIVPICRDGQSLVVATCDPLAQLQELPRAVGASLLDLRLVTQTDYHRLQAALDLNQHCSRRRRLACQ
jgi:hypothetical protein